MKLFLKVIFSIILFEITIGMLHEVVHGEAMWLKPIKFLLSFLHLSISVPLVFVDRTYPFYAEVPGYVAFLLIALNLLLQTFVVWLIARVVLKHRAA